NLRRYRAREAAVVIRRGSADFIRARRPWMSSLRGRIYGCICSEACFLTCNLLDSAGGSIYVPMGCGYIPQTPSSTVKKTKKSMGAGSHTTVHDKVEALIEGLNEVQMQILRLFGEEVCRLYQISPSEGLLNVGWRAGMKCLRAG